MHLGTAGDLLEFSAKTLSFSRNLLRRRAAAAESNWSFCDTAPWQYHHAHRGGHDGFAAYQLKNSARNCASVLKQPPSALVLVDELLSITPRDFTQ